MDTITAARLRELLHYDPLTGIFTRLIGRRGAAIGPVNGWNHPGGYRRAQIDGVPYLLHRLAVLYMTGEMPVAEVDHINGARNDNRWSNLRMATRGENAKNRKRSTKNQTGLKGVTKQPDSNRWRANICVNGQRMYLGLYKTPEAAHQAYCDAAERLHGDFANFGANDNGDERLQVVA